MLYIFTGRAYRSSRRRYPAYLKALNQFTTTAKINPKSPVEKYKSFVKKGLVRSDIHQLKALQQLNKLHEELILYEERLSTSISTELPAESRQNSSSWFSSIFSSTQTIAGNNNSSPSMIHAPKSFYIYGGTGTGKTFLMDLFYDNLTFLKRRRRIHYSNFMLDIHQRLHELKMTDNAKRESFTSSLNRTRAVKKRSSGDSEVHEVWDKISSDIYKESYFICLDEFQVTDIADAVILKNLFASLFDKGVVVIMTSNRPPSDLYQNGLQRDLFLPFIDLVQKRATVHSIVESTIDYRVLKQREQQGKVSKCLC